MSILLCTANEAPWFPDDSLVLTLVTNEELPIDFQAYDEDEEDELEYYVIQSHSRLAVSGNNKIRYYRETKTCGSQVLSLHFLPLTDIYSDCF